MKSKVSAWRCSALSTVVTVIAIAFSSQCLAQVGQTNQGTQTPATPPIQLPLSGRSGQNGSVTATQTPVPGTTGSINTINPSVQPQGPYAGSRPSTLRLPFSGRLSMREALDRAIEYNLGAIDQGETVRQARGQTKVARSLLLPNIGVNLLNNSEQLSLAAAGLSFQSPIPGLSFPTVVGPFNVFDLRATLSQTVFDFTAWKNYRAASELVRSNEYLTEDARDLVTLAVAGVYLQLIAARARLDASRAQLDTANALNRQAIEQKAAGIVAQTDVNRSQMQALTAQQRVFTLQNDLAKQKINLARLTGLPPTDLYDISDDVPFSPAPPINEDSALKQAFDQRPDLKAAEAQVRAAERAVSAARAGRLPSVSIHADYGVIGPNPSQTHGTFSAGVTVHVPIFEGGRTGGYTEQAEAALLQRQAEMDDVRGRIEADVRNAYLDLETAASQVDVALRNIQTSEQNLDLSRQRFEAGISDNTEVIQSQEAVATARMDYINSVFAHNLAKLELARAMGRAPENLTKFLNLK